MSELINARDNRATIRWKLLTGVSALALTGYISSTALAKAEDSNQPLIWLELGGQFQSLTDPSEIWVPANLPPPIDHPVTPFADQTPRIGYNMDGKITFQLKDSDWSFSAAIQYGKAKRGPKAAHDQAYQTHPTLNHAKYALTTYAFTNLNAVEESRHLILDFSAGKDVGLGLFGGHGSSKLSLGVRMAKFDERSDGSMVALTGAEYHHSFGELFDSYVHSARSFDGIGPSVAWNGSVPIAGSQNGELAIDWGVNAALLFGRQKTKSRTHSEHRYYTGGYTYYYSASGATIFNYNTAVRTNVTRSSIRKKNVVVPNVGGLAGISFRKGNAKISFGYKADFFFGAIDGGIDTAKKENRGFYGPFASISIGIGN